MFVICVVCTPNYIIYYSILIFLVSSDYLSFTCCRCSLFTFVAYIYVNEEGNGRIRIDTFGGKRCASPYEVT